MASSSRSRLWSRSPRSMRASEKGVEPDRLVQEFERALVMAKIAQNECARPQGLRIGGVEPQRRVIGGDRLVEASRRRAIDCLGCNRASALQGRGEGLRRRRRAPRDGPAHAGLRRDWTRPRRNRGRARRRDRTSRAPTRGRQRRDRSVRRGWPPRTFVHSPPSRRRRRRRRPRCGPFFRCSIARLRVASTAASANGRFVRPR